MLDKPLMLDIPFYPNTPDNTHCYQAALKMILKYFKPEEEYTWEELEVITAKVEGLWTWPLASMLWLKDRGAQIKYIEDFDYQKFIQLGGQYIIDEYGEEMGNAQIEHSDIAQEQRLSQKFTELIPFEIRIPTLDDIYALLREGFLITCNVNSKALADKPGYSGHAIVLTGYDGENLFLHNPGLPPMQNQKVSNEQFEKAWAYPIPKSKNILAIKI